MRHSNTEWKVELAISGPISVKTRLTLSVEKGHNLPFWTTVDLKNSPHGIIAEGVLAAMEREKGKKGPLALASEHRAA